MRKSIKNIGIILVLSMTLAGCGSKSQNKQVVESIVQEETISEEVISEEIVYEEEEDSYDITLGFAGDVNFAEDWCTMQFYNQQENGIYDCISKELIEEMNAVDIMWINNEFTYSTQGTPMDGKMYTFRANPERVEILKQMGVDVAGLANNHIYDYGKDAFLDTLDTLSDAGILYGGAGKNLEEAMEPVYFSLEGKTIAFVAASRAEKNKMTPQATQDSPGILRCYDTKLFVQEIKEARKNADFVIACVHWGTEYSTQLEEVQMSTAREYLDAGADAIIGAHTHCLQGFEYYDGKPIVYSLGNYWFNEKTLDTMFLKLHITGEENESKIEVQVIPATQSDYQTVYSQSEEERERIYQYLEEISVNVEIDENGRVEQVQ